MKAKKQRAPQKKVVPFLLHSPEQCPHHVKDWLRPACLLDNRPCGNSEDGFPPWCPLDGHQAGKQDSRMVVLEESTRVRTSKDVASDLLALTQELRLLLEREKAPMRSASERTQDVAAEVGRCHRHGSCHEDCDTCPDV